MASEQHVHGDGECSFTALQGYADSNPNGTLLIARFPISPTQGIPRFWPGWKKAKVDDRKGYIVHRPGVSREPLVPVTVVNPTTRGIGKDPGAVALGKKLLGIGEVGGEPPENPMYGVLQGDLTLPGSHPTVCREVERKQQPGEDHCDEHDHEKFNQRIPAAAVVSAPASHPGCSPRGCHDSSRIVINSTSGCGRPLWNTRTTMVT